MKLFLPIICLFLVFIGGAFSAYADNNVDCVTQTKDQMLLTRTRHERGKYLGCFKEQFLHRMFRGYYGEDPNLTIDKCIDLCIFHRFVYAGYHT